MDNKKYRNDDAVPTDVDSILDNEVVSEDLVMEACDRICQELTARIYWDGMRNCKLSYRNKLRKGGIAWIQILL